MSKVNKEYRYFHIENGYVVGFVTSSFKFDDPNFIPVTKENEHYFMRQDILLGVKDGKIVELKEND